MNHEQLIEEWEKDSRFDRSNLMSVIYTIPQLHAKYLRLLQQYKLQVKAQALKFDQLKQVKTRYYNGEMAVEELYEYGWKQYPHVKPTKTGMETLLAGDADLQKIVDKTEYLRILIETTESIMKEVHQMGFLIKSIVELQKFEAGVM